MRIFLDTNVILDYITNRAAFGEDAEAVVEFCRMDGNEGAFSSLSACDAVYILGRAVGRKQAESFVKQTVAIVGLVTLQAESIKRNLGEDHPDFEDSVQISCAQEWGTDVIVTRDKAGFANSPIKVMTPSELLDSVEL